MAATLKSYFVPPNCVRIDKYYYSDRFSFFLPGAYRRVVVSHYHADSAGRDKYKLSYRLYIPPTLMQIFVAREETFCRLGGVTIFAAMTKGKKTQLRPMPLPNINSEGVVCMPSISGKTPADLCARVMQSFWVFNMDMYGYLNRQTIKKYGRRADYPGILNRYFEEWENTAPEDVGADWPVLGNMTPDFRLPVDEIYDPIHFGRGMTRKAPGQVIMPNANAWEILQK